MDSWIPRQTRISLPENFPVLSDVSQGSLLGSTTSFIRRPIPTVANIEIAVSADDTFIALNGMQALLQHASSTTFTYLERTLIWRIRMNGDHQ